MNKPIKVAVTGLGVVSPLGHNTADTWQALMNGHSGVDQIKSFDASFFPTTIASEVKNFDPKHYISDKRILRHNINFNNFAIVAADEALNDAGIMPNETTTSRWGMVVGSGMMNSQFSYWQRLQQRFAKDGQFDSVQYQREFRDFSVLDEFVKSLPNTCLGLLLQRYQIRGYATSVHTACASSGQSIGLALSAIRRGDADYILAGGFDSMINPMGLASFCLLGALSTNNDMPAQASRPFDLTRNGFVLGEGAAFLVLENWDKARARGAKIYAELAGEGNSLSSYRITDSHPSGDGAIQAIERAILDAEADKADVDYINAHGTSTKMNDLCESNAIKHVFGSRAKLIPVSSTKSQTGHLIAAAGALEAVFSVLVLHHAMMPMTANLTQDDPDCDLDYISEGPRAKQCKVVLSNSFGFGGSNSSLLFRHPELVTGVKS